MIAERSNRLVLLVVLAAIAVLARLFEIQVTEHELWAEEASRLVHAGRIVPARRGRILDARGTVLAHDVDAYHLVLSYRDFRRGHPVGQVAHARSALEMRAVPLREAFDRLEEWAEELVTLSPARLDAFAEGAGLRTATLDLPATDRPSDEQRFGRASDLRFYVYRLLAPEKEELGRLRALTRERPEASYAELLAAVRGADVLAALRAEWSATRANLSLLAGLLQLAGTPEYADRGERLDVLIAELEESRRAVESDAASSLFEEAAGFPPGRVAPGTLRTYFALEPIRRVLRWSPADVERWTREARVRWLEGWRDGYAIPRLLAQLTLDPARTPGPDDVLSALAAVFLDGDAFVAALDGEPKDWREFEELEVFARLDSIFRADPPRGLDPHRVVALPIQDPTLRALLGPPAERWRLLDTVRVPPAEERTAQDWYDSLSRNDVERRARRYELALGLTDSFEVHFQSALAETLERIRAAADPDELDADGRLLFARGGLDRAAERARYIQRDFGGRLRGLDDRPDYEIVALVTDPGRFPGFEVVPARERVQVTLEGDERPLAERLIGVVTGVDVRDVQRQREDRHRLLALKHKPKRSRAEEDELIGLVGSVLLSDEVRGVEGIEGFWDRELRGTNGYQEIRGQEELFGAARDWVPVIEASHGADVGLTLVADVQRAAERTINHPEPVADEHLDHRWYRDPVGAIVLLTPEGDVIAAASAPLEASGGAGVYERTLRRPTFTPPGSVFKPFVATWALEELGLDPAQQVFCGPMDDGTAGFGGVRCWRKTGHGPVDLEAALVGSCNAYFAWLGSTFTTADFRGLAGIFGFGRPTGIRALPPGDRRPGRRGLAEDTTPRLFEEELSDNELLRAGNGLGRVEATPMQVGRAAAALSTGRLPEVRIVAAIGGVELLREPAVALPVDPAVLERVRSALIRVPNDGDGTAFTALNRHELGFAVAAKTGSADLVARKERENAVVRKHTWVAGWVPPHRPRAVFVVFVHDTSATSSHGAVYVARQFLRQPEVRAWLSEVGVAVDGGGAEDDR